MTREQALEIAKSQYEWLANNPQYWSPELRKELRGKTPLEIAAALSRSVDRMVNAIVAENP